MNLTYYSKSGMTEGFNGNWNLKIRAIRVSGQTFVIINPSGNIPEIIRKQSANRNLLRRLSPIYLFREIFELPLH